jgi:U3 small nucleolar RNA-associated protein 4
MASWWNREIRIWRVKSKAEGAEKPKVVARIAIQGEDNITSVSISRDGTLLAVATASEVKLFHLAPADPSMGPALRIRKLEMPVTKGAKLVRLADNGKWLAMVTVTNDIQLARIVESDDPTERPRVLPQLLPLYRLRRDELPRDPFNGPWGSYDRSITQAEFSTDSNVFAVADLGGYLDTWIVAGYEDITAPEFDVGSSAHTSATDDGEDSDDDEEEELRKKVITVFGQRWVRNPSGHLLPRLDAAPLLLSFKPLLEGSTRPEPNGTPAMHATRNNPHPHPHSHDTPDVEQQLLVVTAKLELSIVDVLAGRLSEWSRKNPPSVYPSQFRRLDDPVKGCIWDTAENKNRLWLYGEKWLFMFDLSTDFPMDTAEGADAVESTPATKKRKRALVKEAGRKMNSGAGSTIPLGEAPVAKLRKFTSGKGDKSGRSAWIELGSTRHGSGSDEDAYDDLEVRHQVLASMRQLQANDDSPADAVMSVEDAGDKDNSGDDKRRRHESWWNTFKYRPILGIAPVGPADEPLEVVLVERPSWDLDLPPRFVGVHE